LEEMLSAEWRTWGPGRVRGPKAQAGPTAQDAYAILNVSPEASDADIKRAYRRLMSQHHPDKLVSKGLPEEMMEIAKQKTQEIRQAYEVIKEKRKLH
jgi:DnaJ like chaperone protein